MIKHLSPSSVSKFQENQREFFLKYMCEDIPKIPQNNAMSVGSAFDAYIKSDLMARYLGGENKFEELFESGVEEHNRDFARKAGLDVFTQYRDGTAYHNILALVHGSSEWNVNFGYERVNIEGINCPIMALPDLTIKLVDGCCIVLDWKVTGYCSKTGVSPTPGYVNLHNFTHKRHGASHEDADVEYGRLLVNRNNNIKEKKVDWYRQLLTYGLSSFGESEVLLSIEECCFRNGKLTVAEHRVRPSSGDYVALRAEYNHVWRIVQEYYGIPEGTPYKGWFFRDLPREENDSLVATCLSQGSIYKGEMGDFLRSLRG